MDTRIMNRRHVLRLVGGAALAAVPALRLAGEAAAGRTWCQTDPVVKIDGKTADVFLSSYTDLNAAAIGPAQLVITVPVGVSAVLLAVDRSFGGWGYQISFAQSD